MSILDFFLKDKSNYNPDNIGKQQPLQYDNNQVDGLMQINPNKPLQEYKGLPPVIFGNG